MWCRIGILACGVALLFLGSVSPQEKDKKPGAPPPTEKAPETAIRSIKFAPTLGGGALVGTF